MQKKQSTEDRRGETIRISLSPSPSPFRQGRGISAEIITGGIMHPRITSAAIIIAISVTMPLHVISQENPEMSIKAARERALAWLRNQKVPNDVLPDPQPERRNLIMSYEIPRDAPAYRYIFGRSIIYDDALAVIAFTMTGDYKNASQILIALNRLLRKDGGLWFGYNLNNDWPSDKDQDGATDRSGATAWVGYSAVYYLKTRIAADPAFLRTNRDAKAILKLASALGDYLLRLQVKKPGDPRNGLITGGKNSFSLALEGGSVSEIFARTEIDWISIEHNIDAYFFLRDLGALTGNSAFSVCASLIKSNMQRAWSEKDRQYYRGIKPDHMDRALALDCASWGAVFSLAAGNSRYASASLEALEILYISAAPSHQGKPAVRGYKPYAKKEIYEETSMEVTRHYFPGIKNPTWDNLEGVWVEGSMGVALAYLKCGKREKSIQILREILPLQGRSGGFIYFTREIPHEFSTYQSVASTAWFIIMASALEDQAAADSFWSR
jgi:hypothetical protein